MSADRDLLVRPGRSRTRRRLAVGFCAVAAIGGGGAVAAINVASGSGDHQVVVGSAPTNRAQLVDDDLEWSLADAPVGLVQHAGSSHDGDTAYALGPAPGSDDMDEDPPQALYRTRDGIAWESTALPGDMQLDSSAASDGVLFAAGKTRANVGSGPFVVASSRDGGASWTRTSLPFDTVALASVTEPGSYGSGIAADIAAGPSGVVVIVAPHGDVLTSGVPGLFDNADPARLLPPFADWSWGWRIDSDGVVISEHPSPAQIETYASAECSDATHNVSRDLNSTGGHVTCGIGTDDERDVAPGFIVGPDGRKYTWAELGIPSDVAAVLAGKALVYYSHDGVTFARGQLDLALTGCIYPAVAAALGGFVLTIGSADFWCPEKSQGGATELFWSGDGASWELTASFERSSWARALSVPGVAVLIAQSGSHDELTVRTSINGRTWTETDFASLLDAPRGGRVTGVWSDSGDLGVVVTATVEVDAIARRGGVSITHGDVTLRLDNGFGSATVLVGGTEYTSTSWIPQPDDSLRLRPGSARPIGEQYDIEVLDTAGAVMSTFTGFEILSAGSEAEGLPGPTTTGPGVVTETTVDPTAAPPTAESFLLRSVDGQHWSKVKLEDVVKLHVSSVADVLVMKNRIVVTAEVDAPTADDPAASRRVLAIASPRT